MKVAPDPAPGVFVLREDRPSHLIGVEILIASLARRSPQCRTVLCDPPASEAFEAWISRCRQVSVHRCGRGANGWDAKPQVLLEMLDQGWQRVTWLDSDLVLLGDLGARLNDLGKATMLIAEDVWWARAQGRGDRTLAWGLELGRPPRRGVNTAVVSVTAEHRPLLAQWAEMLTDEAYRRAQQLPWDDRPLHLWGDQEVLAALLGSSRWAGLEVETLVRGAEIAQCYDPGGFSPAERLRLASRGRLPLVAHAMGAKPWEVPPGVKRGRYAKVAGRWHQRLSLYTLAALEYTSEIDRPQPWMDSAGGVPYLSRALRCNPVLAELPLSVVDACRTQAMRVGYRLRSRGQRG